MFGETIYGVFGVANDVGMEFRGARWTAVRMAASMLALLDCSGWGRDRVVLRGSSDAYQTPHPALAWSVPLSMQEPLVLAVMVGVYGMGAWMRRAG
jgi:hypothetical protein